MKKKHLLIFLCFSLLLVSLSCSLLDNFSNDKDDYYNSSSKDSDEETAENEDNEDELPTTNDTSDEATQEESEDTIEEAEEAAAPRGICDAPIRFDLNQLLEKSMTTNMEYCFVTTLEAFETYFYQINITNADEIQNELYSNYGDTIESVWLEFSLYDGQGNLVYAVSQQDNAKLPPKGDLKNEFAIASLIPETTGDFYFVLRPWVSTSLPHQVALKLLDEKTSIAKAGIPTNIESAYGNGLNYLAKIYFVELLDSTVRLHFEVAGREDLRLPETSCLISGKNTYFPTNTVINKIDNGYFEGYLEFIRNPDADNFTPYQFQYSCTDYSAPVLFNEYAIISDVFNTYHRDEIIPPGIILNQVSATCEQADNSSVSINKWEILTLTWQLFTVTEDQMIRNLQYIDFKVTIDGKPIDEINTSEIRKTSNSEGFQYVTEFSINILPLDLGKHTVKIVTTWDEIVSNGKSTFGPGGEVESTEGNCTIEVGN